MLLLRLVLRPGAPPRRPAAAPPARAGPPVGGPRAPASGFAAGRAVPAVAVEREWAAPGPAHPAAGVVGVGEGVPPTLAAAPSGGGAGGGVRGVVRGCLGRTSVVSVEFGAAGWVGE